MTKQRRQLSLLCATLALLLFVAGGSPSMAQKIKPPEVPAKIKLSVNPDSVAPGKTARVTVELDPIDGVKINKYPKITVSVPAREGLVGEARATQGTDTPPPEDQLKTNYFKELKPLELTLDLDPQAPRGKHELDGKITYNYCMPANGFCARKRVPVKIPIAVQ